MSDVDRVAFVRLSPRGLPVEHWLAMLAKRGFPVKLQDDPYFIQVAEKLTKKKVRITKVNSLNTALNSIRPGGLFGVPNFSHFASLDIWFDVSRRLALKSCKVQCCETGQILDPTKGEDVALGASMVTEAFNRRRGQTMTQKRVAMGVTGGRKKLPLTGARLREALDLFVDLEWSLPAIATKFEMSLPTFLRRIGEATGTKSRSAAVLMHQDGKWPPEPKRRAGRVKDVEAV